jgi:hypothetical protein
VTALSATTSQTANWLGFVGRNKSPPFSDAIAVAVNVDVYSSAETSPVTAVTAFADALLLASAATEETAAATAAGTSDVTSVDTAAHALNALHSAYGFTLARDSATADRSPATTHVASTYFGPPPLVRNRRRVT